MVLWTPDKVSATPPGRIPLTLRLQIELIYDPGCPNVDRTREVLAIACRDAEIPAVWTEWSTGDPGCPA